MNTLHIILLLGAWSVYGQILPSDILSVDYLPSTMLLEGEALKSSDLLEDNSTDWGGDLGGAFLTMQYHRSQMNEYLCRVYLADEILTELGTADSPVGRVGTPAVPNNHKLRSSLLTDEGSSSYKEWLSRSTLLDDIYRHYDTAGGANSEDEEIGQVTGYAVPGLPGGGKSTGPRPGIFSDLHPGYPTGPLSPGYATPQTFGNQHHPGEEVWYGGEVSHDKSLAVKDLFDLALTALAFLAFGVFVMNLIMTCIMGPQGTTIVMQMMTTSTTSTGDGGNKHRKKRSLEEDLNELAYRVARSTEVVLGLRGTRECLSYRLCEDNRRSRRMGTRHRLWLPLWSFGLSWISGHIGGDRLANLRGAVLGLGTANCQTAYPTCHKS